MLQKDAPDWAHDPVKLWNSLQLANKRKDVQTSRETEVSHPREFAQEMRQEATAKYAAMIVCRYGGAVQYAIYAPDTKKGSDIKNWHSI